MELKAPERIIVYSVTPYTFVVFGCGGTGSYLIRDLARIIGIYNAQYGRNDTMLLVDGDEVEEHNLARQNFIRADIGKNKAEVLARRYGNAYGVRIGFIPQYIRQNNTNLIWEGAAETIPFLIGCVDNNKTRAIIHGIYRDMYRTGIIYLDSGNEEYAGQVVFSTNYGLTSNGYGVQFNSGGRSYSFIKDAVEQFQLAPTDRHPDDLSCAERAVHAPQNIATNILAANTLFNYCNTILSASVDMGRLNTGDGMLELDDLCKSVRAISSHITYFNSRTGGVTLVPFGEEVTKIISVARLSRQRWIDEEREIQLRERLEEQQRAGQEAAATITAPVVEAIVAEEPQTSVGTTQVEEILPF